MGGKTNPNILKYFTGVKVQEQDWKAFQSSKQRKKMSTQMLPKSFLDSGLR